MRVAFVGHYGQLHGGDMGTKATTHQLAKEVSSRHEVLRVNIREPFSWRRIRGFKPDVIHFVLGPASITSFFIMSAMRACCPGARTVLTATLPLLSFRPLISMMKPDLVLVQSLRAEAEFSGLGCRTVFLPNGVDVNRFVPARAETKAKIRESLSLDPMKFTVLYAGSLIQRRNIQALGKLADQHTQVVLAGRTPRDDDACHALQSQGCIVWQSHFPQMEKIYTLADCYVFPIPPQNLPVCVETPLTVLEAMSCNLFVISTSFGALPRLFSEGDGFYFARKDDDYRQYLEQIRNSKETAKTRQKVLPYTWSGLVDKLNAIYEDLF